MSAPLHGSLVGAALQLLAGKCDGARTWDGKGFSGYDANFGHDLAEKFARNKSFVSEKQHAAAKKLCHKYRKQLAEAGFDLEALQAEGFAVNPEARQALADAQAQREAAKLARSATVVRVLTLTGESASGAAFKAVTNLRRTEWLPKSQLRIVRRIDLRTRNGKMLAIVEAEMPAWLAEAKGATQGPLGEEAWAEASAAWAQAQSAINAEAVDAWRARNAERRAEACRIIDGRPSI